MSETAPLDYRALAALEDLPLAARTVVEGFMSGMHRSPFLGYSSEFSSYRPYMQGDDLRHVDWKLWGRSDEFYVKQFEDDTNLCGHIFLDASASMDFGQASKFQQARLLAAAISYLMARQHDAPGVFILGGDRFGHLPPRSTREHLDRIMEAMSNARPSGRARFDSALWNTVETITRRGMAVIISDFFAEEDEWLQLLRRLQAQRQEIIVFQLLAPEELTFDFEGELLVEDLETGQLIPLHAADIRRDYQQGLDRFQRHLQEECARLEADYQLFRTDAPWERALIRYLDLRNRV